MLTPVAFPDVELWAVGYLRAALAARPEPYASATVQTIVPKPLPDRLVTVRRDGGPRLDQVRESARLTVQVWGSTEQEATDLARLVAALMWAAPDGDPVLRVTQNSGPSPIPDTKPHRLMSFDVVVRGTEI